MISWDLVANAVVAGILLGGFYAAVSLGVSLTFGLLDVVNIAHPAFVILGAYAAYMMNSTLGLDPILTGVLFTPLFYAIGAGVYRIYYASFERRGEESLRGLVFFFGVLFIIEVTLSLTYGVDYRLVEAVYIGKSIELGGIGIAFRLLVPCVVGLLMTLALYLFLSRTFYGRAVMGVSQDQVALRLMGADPVRIKTIAFGIGIAAASLGRLADHDLAGRAVDRSRLHRSRLRDHGPGRPREHRWDTGRLDHSRNRREPDGDLLRAVLVARGLVRNSPAGPGRTACRALRAIAGEDGQGARGRCSRRRARDSPGQASHQPVHLLRRVYRPAIRRHRHRVERPRWLRRLRELRHPGVFCPRGVHRDLPHRGVQGSAAGADRRRGAGLGAPGARHRVPHAPLEGGLLLDRDLRALGRAADAHHQLGIRRRREG